ncbi:MAG: DUF2806 domain-containing protein [Treponema sp.]|nr:DUF2806 domain-containing protein [Treponema sp.]
MGDFNLIKIDGKPIEKLLDVVSKAIGKIYEPRAIRKEADARAYEVSVIEKAKIDASVYRYGIEQDMLDKIEERRIFMEIRRQTNIDNVVKLAINELKDDNNISSTPVDKDWAVRFFNIVEDISNEQMQQLWGKILAGEVKSPNSFSLHTIEYLKNMSKEEADLFSEAANYVIHDSEDPVIFKSYDKEMLENNGFSFDDVLSLIELRLIHSETNIGKVIPKLSEDISIIFYSGTYKIKVIKKANTPKCEIPVYKFTAIGNELIKLLTITPIDNYINEFKLFLQKSGFSIEGEPEHERQVMRI